jgi:hypothetical protein
MRVMYSAPFSKLIASMDSLRLKLSNGILLVIFHHRLTIFFHFQLNAVEENRTSRGKMNTTGKKVRFLPSWSPAPMKRVKEKCGVLRVDYAYAFRAHSSLLMRHKDGAPGSHKYLFLQKPSPAPNT